MVSLWPKEIALLAGPHLEGVLPKPEGARVSTAAARIAEQSLEIPRVIELSSMLRLRLR